MGCRLAGVALEAGFQVLKFGRRVLGKEVLSTQGTTTVGVPHHQPYGREKIAASLAQMALSA